MIIKKCFWTSGCAVVAALVDVQWRGSGLMMREMRELSLFKVV